jgi:hypothetical protein
MSRDQVGTTPGKPDKSGPVPTWTITAFTRTLPHSRLVGFNVSVAVCYTPKLLARTEPMSFDLGVWYPQKRIRNEEATELYLRLCDGDTSGVLPNPAIDAFYAELIARHPEIDMIPEEKIDDHDYCPWSCKLDYSPSHVVMSCVWSKATYVHQLVRGLARKHGLALYDPQSEEVIYPDGSTGAKTNASRTSLWILGAFALLFAAVFVYSGQVSTSRAPVVFYVFAALCVLMAVVCFRQAALGGTEPMADEKSNMDDGITVETEMFEHREVKPHFINPCCFGEDFAAWLKEQIAGLKGDGFRFSEIIQEDYGWGFWLGMAESHSGWRSHTLVMDLKSPPLNGSFLSITIPD